MPRSKLDRFFGGKSGSAHETLAKMKKTYGPKQGQKVFDGIVAKQQHRETKAKRGR